METNEELWYLIGIQADITGLSKWNVPEDHVAELQEIAAEIRNKLVKEISRLAADGMEERQVTDPQKVSKSYKLLQEPVWRKGCLSKKAVMDLTSKLDNQAKAPKRRAFSLPLGGLSTSVLLLSVVSFLTGLLLGRGSRRSQ